MAEHDYEIVLRGKDLGVVVGGALGITNIGVFLYSPHKAGGVVSEYNLRHICQRKRVANIPLNRVRQVEVDGKLVWQNGGDATHYNSGGEHISITLNPDVEDNSGLVKSLLRRGILNRHL